jgi:hypothetical protein
MALGGGIMNVDVMVSTFAQFESVLVVFHVLDRAFFVGDGRHGGDEVLMFLGW